MAAMYINNVGNAGVHGQHANSNGVGMQSSVPRQLARLGRLGTGEKVAGSTSRAA